MRKLLFSAFLICVTVHCVVAQCGPNGHLGPIGNNQRSCIPNTNIVVNACSATVTTNCTPQINSFGLYFPTVSGGFTALTGHATSTATGGATDVTPFYEVSVLPPATAAVTGRLYRNRAATAKDVCPTVGDSGG